MHKIKPFPIVIYLLLETYECENDCKGTAFFLKTAHLWRTLLYNFNHISYRMLTLGGP